MGNTENKNKSQREQAIEFISKIKLPLNISRTNYITSMLICDVITYNDIPAEILENYKFNIEEKTKIDLSKLVIINNKELRWEVNIPITLSSNKIITKTVEFDYYKDKKGKYWLSNCEVPEEFHQQGIGSFMIKQAIRKYGQVYFSNATRLEFNTKYPNHGYDSRYLNEYGKIFVSSLIRNKIIPEDWLRFPEL